MSLDTKTNTLIISPIYGKADNLAKIEIEFDDKPGSLAKLAETLAKNKHRPCDDRIQKFPTGSKGTMVHHRRYDKMSLWYYRD
jgi:hypothetical protein